MLYSERLKRESESLRDSVILLRRQRTMMCVYHVLRATEFLAPLSPIGVRRHEKVPLLSIYLFFKLLYIR